MILNPERFRETETVREILRRPTSRLYRRLSQIFGRDPGLVSRLRLCVLWMYPDSRKLFNGKLKRDLQMEHESSDFDLANIL